jgi:hypothetical protein
MRFTSLRISLIALFALVIFISSAVFAATTGVIDPNNQGKKYAIVDDGSQINFGDFTTQSAYNLTVTSSELRGYAWGENLGWIVVNCADTNTGCASPGINGSFKVANDGTGLLSGFAWGEIAGWINFGPFTNTAISRVKINPTTGEFGGSLGSAGYAWSENFGFIKFDCTDPDACVVTDWRPSATTTSTTTTTGGGTPGPGISSTTTTTSTSSTSSTGTGTPTGPTSSTTSSSGTAGSPTASSTSSTSGTGSPTSTTTTSGTSATNSTTSSTAGNSTAASSTGSGTSSTGSGSGTGYGGGGPFLPTVGSVIKDFIDQIGGTLSNIPGSKEIGKAVAVIGATAGVAATTVAALFANPLVVSDIFSIPLRLWSLVLAAFGFRRKPWGVVYDSVTKQPLDPVYVVLKDASGNDAATSISDLSGRFGFLAKPGIYTMVAGKTNYVFPSQNLRSKISDELYQDLYFGEPITITREGEVITKNIPMDPVGFDWNEFAKREQKLMSFYTERTKWFARITTIAFYVGLVVSLAAFISAPKILNGFILALYGLIFLLRRLGVKPKSWGGISDSRGYPAPFSIIRVYSAATKTEITHKVADATGRYYCLIQNGTYYVTIDRKNGDGSYTRVLETQPFAITKGFLNKSFVIQ